MTEPENEGMGLAVLLFISIALCSGAFTGWLVGAFGG